MASGVSATRGGSGGGSGERPHTGNGEHLVFLPLPQPLPASPMTPLSEAERARAGLQSP